MTYDCWAEAAAEWDAGYRPWPWEPEGPLCAAWYTSPASGGYPDCGHGSCRQLMGVEQGEEVRT